MNAGWKKKKCSSVSAGSYTVEAAILFPLLLAVIISLMQICLMFHDRTVVSSLVELTALQVAEGKAETVTDRELDNRLLISEVVETGIRETQTSVEVFAQVESRRIVPLYFRSGKRFVKEYSVTRKKLYAKEKTIISEVLLDAFHLLE